MEVEIKAEQYHKIRKLCFLKKKTAVHIQKPLSALLALILSVTT